MMDVDDVSDTNDCKIIKRRNNNLVTAALYNNNDHDISNDNELMINNGSVLILTRVHVV